MIPQDFASYITKNELPTKSDDLLDKLLWFLEVQDEQEGMVTYTYKNLEDEDPIQDSESKDMKMNEKLKQVKINEGSNILKNKILIQTLFKSLLRKNPGAPLGERKIAISANGLQEIVRKWPMWYSKRCFLSILPETSFPLLLTGFLVDF